MQRVCAYGHVGLALVVLSENGYRRQSIPNFIATYLNFGRPIGDMDDDLQHISCLHACRAENWMPSPTERMILSMLHSSNLSAVQADDETFPASIFWTSGANDITRYSRIMW